MATPLRSVLLGILIGTCTAVPVVHACGDKLLAIGGGVSFERVFSSRHPGNLILFVSPLSPLRAANDELRDRLFPINRKYPLSKLIEACRQYPLGERERLTFEYVMLDGVNDSDRDAKELVALLSGIRAKVNLIPHNPAPELPYHASPMERILAFQEVLTRSGLASFIRRPRGQDISAACGQLAARHGATA